ncbi:stimulated by retinoic acid gene 6 protein-like isoform X2 [Dysidea avara]|uniref:stimulated by retinoic acid gene 6 protein-like isoform X2 n=1 Tax=Dysidea avara TaxID=196820 RepID=UPI0033308463
MGIFQLSLTMVALVSCTYEGELSDCLQSEGFGLMLEVLSQLSADGSISPSTIDEVERVLLDRCSNDSRRDPTFRGERECVNAVEEIINQLRVNESNPIPSPQISSSSDECDSRAWLNVGLLSIAFIILAVLSFTKTRSSFYKYFLWGIPGIVIPVNLLQSKQNHFIYVIIFGSLASDVLANIFNPSTEFLAEGYNSIWFSTLIFYVQVLLQTLYFAPLLACVNAPVKLLGYSLGLLYAMYFAAIRLAQIAAFYDNCVYFSSELTHLYPLVELPTYITLLLVCLWYAINTFGAVRKLYSWYAYNTLLSKEKKTHRYILRVRKLLTKSRLPPQNEEGLKNKITSIIYRWYKQEGLKNKVAGLIYKYGFDPSFHYPLGFSSAILITAICIYQLTLQLTLVQISASRWLNSVIKTFEKLIRALIGSSISLDLYTYIQDASVFIEVVTPLVPITAGLFCLTLMFLLLINVRENVKQLCKGNSSFLPEKKPVPTYMVASAIRYIGYQVGYFVWTWVIGILVLYVSVVLAFIYLLFLRIDHETVISWTAALLVPTLISTVLYYGQVYFIKYFFLQDRGITLSLTNVKFFHWFQFMMIFFNIVVGLFSALARNIYSLAFGLLLMPRLDHTVMMKGLEGWDSGYKTYIGFLHLNHYYNNAVVNIFCILLYNSVRPVFIKKTLTIRDSNSELNKIAYQCDQIQRNQADSHPVTSRLSFNRWFVAYTLLKNPELQKLRGHTITAANQTTVSDENKPQSDKQSDICSETEIDESIL